MRLLFIATILSSITAFASFDCTSTDKPGYRVIAISRIGAPSTVTVKYNDKNIYHKPVVDSPDRNGQTFMSLGFTNKKNAPSSLFLNVYQNENQALIGQFNEGSWAPVVPSLQLECKSL